MATLSPGGCDAILQAASTGLRVSFNEFTSFQSFFLVRAKQDIISESESSRNRDQQRRARSNISRFANCGRAFARGFDQSEKRPRDNKPLKFPGSIINRR